MERLGVRQGSCLSLSPFWLSSASAQEEGRRDDALFAWDAHVPYGFSVCAFNNALGMQENGHCLHKYHKEPKGTCLGSSTELKTFSQPRPQI